MQALAEQIATYATEKRLSASTLARWRAWAEEDQAVFLTLARALQLGENHMRDFLDWLEEIVARDGCTIREVLTRPEVARPLKIQGTRNDKLKAVKDALRKVRYPRLSRLEETVHAAVKALDLGSRVRVSFPPAFEGDEVTVEIRVRNVQELEDSVIRLHQRLEDGTLQQLFALLEQV